MGESLSFSHTGKKDCLRRILSRKRKRIRREGEKKGIEYCVTKAQKAGNGKTSNSAKESQTNLNHSSGRKRGAPILREASLRRGKPCF